MRTSYVIWLAISMHVVWAAALLLSPAPTGVTAISELLPLARVPAMLPILLGLVAGLAIFGVQHRKHPGVIEIACLLPQQTALMAGAIGAGRAMLAGHFADGVIRPTEFLVADQIVAILLAYWHAVAILDYLTFRGEWRVPAWTHR